MPVESSWMARLRADAPLAPSVRHLSFEVDLPSDDDARTPGAPRGFHWLPGQYVELFDPAAPEQRFPYSVASAEQSAFPGRFELAVRRDGSAAPVERLRVGDRIGVAPPRGSFVRPGDRVAPAILVANGTGVAPMRAMIQSAFAHRSPAELLLLFGCRSEADLLWERELTELALHPRFVFLPTLSQPGPEWRGRRGYVQAHLGELEGSIGGADVFVCGSRAMVTDVAGRLRELGVPAERLQVEGH